MKHAKLLLSLSALALAAAPLSAQGTSKVAWGLFNGPMGEQWSRLGTDGTDLYFTTNGSELWRYTFPAGNPTGGTWTQLSTAPRTINGWDSYRGLAFQNGYFYTSAISNTGFGRTVLRYDIAMDSWEAWGNPTGTGSDIDTCFTSGNAMYMDPTTPGLGFSAWHGGNWWCSFDWNAQTANNNWMSTSGLVDPIGQPLLDPQWVSRNEFLATDGQGNYYATKNDWTSGLSSGDAIYTWVHSAAPVPTTVTQKPFECGCGQTLTFIPATHPLNHTGVDELWLIRGGDGAVAPQEGWSNLGTTEWGILPLLSGADWILFETDFFQGTASDAVLIGDYLFYKASGDATNANAVNADFYAGEAGAFAWPYGSGCPGSGGFTARAGATERPVLGNAAFAIEVNELEGFANLALLIGFSNLNWNGTPLPLDLGILGFTGCSLWTAIDIQFSAAAGAGNPGQASGSFPIPLPVNPLFAGVTAYAQWLVADSAGVSFSDGLEIYLDTQ